MKRVIIGTAGHVDHGKTTLIHALTGTNPDRLKEEQERGMTIDIGFAALRLPDGTIAGIVDVPGHERFLKNMLAGASGVDVVLLVIAADESVMPQTQEHLDILRILDVKNGVVALTKCDMADREWIETVEADIRERLAGTFLENAPIIQVSVVQKRGLGALKKALMAAVSRCEARNPSLPFRLPIDRVFTRPGFGTVVTGALASGTLRVGDAVEIVPQQIATRVRGIQVHGEKRSEAIAGMRVAVNIAGVETEAIERGAQLAPPNALAPTESFDGLLRLLPSAEKPLKDRARVRLHIGTAELIGRVRLLDSQDILEAGKSAYIQFLGEEKFACARGDRFVVRSYSPMHTLGGGYVLDSAPTRHRKGDVALLEALKARERGTPEDLLETALLRYPAGVLRKELTVVASLTSEAAEGALNALLAQNRAVCAPNDRVFLQSLLQSHLQRATSALTAYHEQFPLRPGIPKEELRAALGKDFDPKAFGSLLGLWQIEGRMALEGSVVRLAAFKLTLNERQEALLGRIEDYYRQCFIATPPIEEVSRFVLAPPDAILALLRVGVDQGRFVKVSEGVYYDTQTLARLKEVAREVSAKAGALTVAGFRDATQSNRKFAMQALEYFDTVRFTARHGDERILL